jgi:hypothetical protein
LGCGGSSVRLKKQNLQAMNDDNKKKAAAKKKMAAPPPAAPVKKEPLMVEKADGSIGQWGNNLQPNPAPERKIKLSNAANDAIGQTEFDDIVKNSGLSSDRQMALSNSSKNGFVEPDQGDVIKRIRAARAKKKPPVDDNLRESM